MREGAAGYLLKNISPGELETAIRAVVRGDVYLHSAIAKHAIAGRAPGGAGEADSLERLTPRQRKVLRLVAEGNTNKVIARKLQISVKTVEKHRAELMGTLGLRDAASLVRFAVRMGVVRSDG